MHVTSTTTLDDWREFQGAVLRHLIKTKRPRRQAAWSLFSVATWMVVAFLIMSTVDEIDWATVGVTSLIFVLAFVDYLYDQYRRARALHPFPRGMALGEHEFEFGLDGIDVTGPYHRLHVEWELVTAYLDTPHCLIVLLEDVNGLVLRREDIPDIDALRQLIDEHSAIVPPELTASRHTA